MKSKYLIAILILISPVVFCSELEKLAEADQKARQGNYENIDWSIVSKEDEARRRKVKEILSEKRLFSAKEYYSAALIMQHGNTSEDYYSAFQYAKKAKRIDPKDEGAAWLACAAEDRYLLKVNKKQVWGTQLESKFNDDNSSEILYLIDFDGTVKSDKERVTCLLPSLHEMKRRLKVMSKMENLNEQFKYWLNGT